jgi:hypothetical protein
LAGTDQSSGVMGAIRPAVGLWEGSPCDNELVPHCTCWVTDDKGGGSPRPPFRRYMRLKPGGGVSVSFARFSSVRGSQVYFVVTAVVDSVDWVSCTGR